MREQRAEYQRHREAEQAAVQTAERCWSEMQDAALAEEDRRRARSRKIAAAVRANRALGHALACCRRVLAEPVDDTTLLCWTIRTTETIKACHRALWLMEADGVGRSIVRQTLAGAEEDLSPAEFRKLRAELLEPYGSVCSLPSPSVIPPSHRVGGWVGVPGGTAFTGHADHRGGGSRVGRGSPVPLAGPTAPLVLLGG